VADVRSRHRYFFLICFTVLGATPPGVRNSRAPPLTVPFLDAFTARPATTAFGLPAQVEKAKS
jgi:hypothetical protein